MMVHAATPDPVAAPIAPDPKPDPGPEPALEARETGEAQPL
jgi:hypothetical protein